MFTRGATMFSKSGVQFLGLGYCTEQNTDGIPSFVDCSLLRNGNHTLHQKVGVVRPNFGGSGPPTPSGCALEKEKGKERRYLYSAFIVATTLKALRRGSHSFTCK